MKRNYSIDVLKLFLSYIVAFSHIGMVAPFGANTAVHIFFVISGYFLARKFYESRTGENGGEYSPLCYTKERVRHIYPHYIFSLVMLLAARLVLFAYDFLRAPSVEVIENAVQMLYKAIPEAVLLQNTGLYSHALNYPTWQIAALLIAGYFVYGLLHKSERTAVLYIFPAAILLIQTLLTDARDVWGNFGCFPIPLLRAFSSLCIGVLLYRFCVSSYYAKLKEKRTVLNLLSILSLAALLAYGSRGNVHLITSVILLLGLFDPMSWLNKLFNRPCFRHFGPLSLSIYLNHVLITLVLELPTHWLSEHHGIVIGDVAMGILYFVLLMIYSVFTMWLMGRFKALAAKKKLQTA